MFVIFSFTCLMILCGALIIFFIALFYTIFKDIVHGLRVFMMDEELINNKKEDKCEDFY